MNLPHDLQITITEDVWVSGAPSGGEEGRGRETVGTEGKRRRKKEGKKDVTVRKEVEEGRENKEEGRRERKT